MTLYLDNNATTPVDPRVQREIHRCFAEEWGNAGSTHEFGRRAKAIVHATRDKIAALVGARRHDIVFTSGATESNNLAILGLAEQGQATGKKHIVSTLIEHKSVLEPLQILQHRGFNVTLVPPTRGGQVDCEAIVAALRPETLLVSVMQVNNETGVIQPIQQIAERLEGRDLFFHVDAAQGFGKEFHELIHSRIDFISVSSHKIFGPVGVGALVVRHRRDQQIPLTPLLYGGGQELGLRPGTLPVALISGFGLAAELASSESDQRSSVCREIRELILTGLRPLNPHFHGDPGAMLPHVLNLSFPNLDGDHVVELLEGIAAVSTGSACTSVCATASHVLAAMQIGQPHLDGAVRFSWSHMTDPSQLKLCLSQIVSRLSDAGCLKN